MRPISSAPKHAQLAESKPNLSNAVESAGTGAPLLFADAIIDGIQVQEALVDTGFAFSLLSSTFYARLRTKPTICSFKNSAFDIVGGGGESATVRGYIDVPLQIAGAKLSYPL